MVQQRINMEHLERFKQLCNRAGIKVTHQRLEIYKELISVSDHPSAECIHKRLQQRIPTIAIDTVYRTLATFAELGLVKKLHVMNERTLFDTNVDVHHHFVCTRCREVRDVDWREFDKLTLPEVVAGLGEIKSRHLEIHGVCTRCLEEAGREEIP